ncbi:inosine 5'-monophosphate dehydrogenase [Entomoplasma ellychniae]|uniref:Inosine 5'-monophosphate dehydrogenase n=1 Tax=Entomoplasma ellychniae TaxID=2114 RepID=A0A8E2U9W7_9MOLU|nr:IMP dehydrogenase [Entomoplasma ellychniae]PPE04574.1 inosine 5'-monophosphate dehydrogenase [Entomoplasma ellychniae]
MKNNLNGKIINQAMTFDDVLLVPNYSEVLPHQTELKTKFVRDIYLNIPIISAAMDTVTESELAIAIACVGGIGIIHKNFSIQQQAEQIITVKNKLVVNLKDASLDKKGRLLVGGAVGVNDETLKRVEILVQAGVDVIVVDSAHGHSKGILDTIKSIRKIYKDLPIIGGNICTQEGAKALYEAGVDGIKVGIGPGSICTTRIVAGVGVPQITAINDVYEWAKEKDVTVIADGGIKYSGDIVKAIAAGAQSVMLGSMLAGTNEAPGKEIHINGKTYKTYVGMGSLVAMERGSSDRYFQTGAKKLVPEGIEGIVPHKGDLNNVIFQLIGGIRSGMGYTGNKTIEELRKNAKFVRITSASLKESHPHDIQITAEAPNYK